MTGASADTKGFIMFESHPITSLLHVLNVPVQNLEFLT